MWYFNTWHDDCYDSNIMNLDTFEYDLIEMRARLKMMRKSRRERFIKEMPYHLWFWLIVTFSIYLVSPF